MERLYFTLVGTGYCFGDQFLEPGMEVHLVKEPDNTYDKEAIRVEMDGLGLIGYVANSPNTVQGESLSAGRLYDRIGDEAKGTVVFCLSKGILCSVCEKDIIYQPPVCRQNETTR